MIVPMKKAQIVVLKDDKDKLLKSIQRYGELMIIKDEDHSDYDIRSENTLSQRTDKSLQLMKKYKEKQGLFNKEFKEVNYSEFVTEDPNRLLMLDRIEEYDSKINNLKSQNEVLTEEIKGLKPWEELDFSTIKVKDLRYASIHTVFVERRNAEKFINALETLNLPFNLLGYDNNYGQAFIFAVYKNDNEEVFTELGLIGYNEIKLEKTDLLIKDIIQAKEKTITDNLDTIYNLQENLRSEAQKVTELEILSDQINSHNEIKKAYHKQTLNTVYLEGWVRSDRVERLEKSINSATDIYDLAISEPGEEEIPPTVTKNPKFIQPFEIITDMFARPTQEDIDPNPLMSFWYWLIFGMMMGDAGYGVVMLILFGGFIKIMKPKGEALKLFRVLCYSGITTIFWGVMFGSYFGVTWNPIMFVPMDEPLKMLIFSLIFGAVHILSGVVAKAYKNFKNGNYMDIIYDQLSWIMMIVGIGFLVVPSLSQIGIILAVAGAGIVLLTAGRQKKNIFARLGSGFTGLYGITGYMSDILSYSRLLALGLSTAVISYVMNLLAGMLQSNPVGFAFSLIVYVVGHAFNIIMGLLSAYVHDSRLQYIEFFGKFYEGGGYAFEPLSLKLKYVDKVNEK